MRLHSFHPDVRQLLLSIGNNKVLTGDIQWVALRTTKAYEWLRGKVPTAQIHQDLNTAIGMCEANRGDLIVVAPGHYEDIADTSSSGAIDLDIAGITVLGLGRGTDTPRFDFNHADADFILGAANVAIENLHFEATVTSVKIGVSVEAAATNFSIKNCRFTVETTATDEFLDSISIAAAANYGEIVGCRFDSGLGGAVSAIVMEGASVGHKITDNWILGDYSTACIEGGTAASTLLEIGRNILVNGDGSNLGTEPAIDLAGNATGVIYENRCVCNLTTKAAAIVAARCLLFDNYYNEDISSAGTGGIIGTASADD